MFFDALKNIVELNEQKAIFLDAEQFRRQIFNWKKTVVLREQCRNVYSSGDRQRLLHMLLCIKLW